MKIPRAVHKMHIRHIRQKLGDDAHYIETIRGVGYKFNDRQENRL